MVITPEIYWAWSGKVIGISDGDTITVLRDKEQVRIRLYGIDCPEGGQAFGNKAKKFTSDMVFAKVVEVEPVDTDRYGRTVALVAVFNRLINEELVNAGYAWVYTYYCTKPICERWKALEYEARDAKRGLWADPHAIPPWEFRREKRGSELSGWLKGPYPLWNFYTSGVECASCLYFATSIFPKSTT